MVLKFVLNPVKRVYNAVAFYLNAQNLPKNQYYALSAVLGGSVGFGLNTTIHMWEVEAKDGRTISFYRVRAKNDPVYYTYYTKRGDAAAEHTRELAKLIELGHFDSIQPCIDRHSEIAEQLENEYNKII